MLSVDNYRAAVGDERLPLLEAVELWPNASGLAGWEALDRIAVLFAHARAAGVPVIHITGMAPGGHPGSRAGPRAAADAPRWSATTRRSATDTAVATTSSSRQLPSPGEVVLTKTAPSAFFGTPLVAHLLSQGIDTLIVVGEAVSGCVRATVVDGCSYRLNMIVVEDCVYDRHEATRAMNLFDIDQKYGDVIGLDEALAHLDGVGGTDAAHDDGHGHGHGHHSHSEESDDETPVALPVAVTRRLPAGATPREVCLHQLSGHVVARAGQEVIDAAGAEMVTGFTSRRPRGGDGPRRRPRPHRRPPADDRSPAHRGWCAADRRGVRRPRSRRAPEGARVGRVSGVWIDRRGGRRPGRSWPDDPRVRRLRHGLGRGPVTPSAAELDAALARLEKEPSGLTAYDAETLLHARGDDLARLLAWPAPCATKDYCSPAVREW